MFKMGRHLPVISKMSTCLLLLELFLQFELIHGLFPSLKVIHAEQNEHYLFVINHKKSFSISVQEKFGLLILTRKLSRTHSIQCFECNLKRCTRRAKQVVPACQIPFSENLFKVKEDLRRNGWAVHSVGEAEESAVRGEMMEGQLFS